MGVRGTKTPLPGWLNFYLRIWEWLPIPLAVILFWGAAVAQDKFFVILLSALGGALLAFLASSILYKIFVKPRLLRLLSPDSN